MRKTNTQERCEPKWFKWYWNIWIAILLKQRFSISSERILDITYESQVEVRDMLKAQESLHTKLFTSRSREDLTSLGKRILKEIAAACAIRSLIVLGNANLLKKIKPIPHHLDKAMEAYCVLLKHSRGLVNSHLSSHKLCISWILYLRDRCWTCFDLVQVLPTTPPLLRRSCPSNGLRGFQQPGL